MMKNGKTVVVIALLLAVVMGSAFTASAEMTLSGTDLNPEYQKYIEDQEEPMLLDAEEQESGTNYVPAPYVEVNEIYAVEHVSEELPSSYDAREDGKITPPKDQGTDGVCWAFAGTSSLEAMLMPEREYDFSEQHARFALSSVGGNDWGYDRDASDGGNFSMYATYLMRWSGPVLEEEDPYDLSVKTREVSVTDGFEEQFHVQGFLSIPNPAQTVERVTAEQRAAHVNLIKQYVKDYGSVFTSIYYNAGSYYNSATYSYYYPGEATCKVSNHAVSIVGWDDNYSKDHFKSKPSADGAFLIKNSWGESFGDQGYFYLSYEDAYAGWNAGVISQVDEKGTLDHIYQYDPFCLTAAYGYKSSLTGKTVSQACFANVFSVESDQEALKAVSVYTAAPDTTCRVYINAEGGRLDSFDRMTFVGEETFEMSGYHTIDLSEQIPLTGEKFAVAVQVKSTVEEQRMIPLEMPLTVGDITNSKCTANPGESFISYDSKAWMDLTEIVSNTNVLLKAYTVDIPSETKIGFVDESGEEITGWTAGETVKAKTTYYNDSPSSVDARAYLAVYEGGRLIAVSASDVTDVLPGHSAELETDSVTVPLEGEYQVRQFLWNNENEAPLCNWVELSEK